MKRFTLIELVIIIAIMGILLTLLLPSIKNAQLLAKSALCKSNLSQQYSAIQLYGKEGTYRLPKAVEAENTNGWTNYGTMDLFFTDFLHMMLEHWIWNGNLN